MIGKFLMSAIIGYWRSGATLDEISDITWFKKYQIEYVIHGYKKQLLYDMTRKDLHYLRPDIFIRESLSFMQGYPKWKVWLYMPIAYIKICYHTLFKK